MHECLYVLIHVSMYVCMWQSPLILQLMENKKMRNKKIIYLMMMVKMIMMMKRLFAKILIMNYFSSSCLCMYVCFEHRLSTPAKSPGQEQSNKDWICVSNCFPHMCFVHFGAFPLPKDGWFPPSGVSSSSSYNHCSILHGLHFVKHTKAAFHILQSRSRSSLRYKAIISLQTNSCQGFLGRLVELHLPTRP